MINLEITVNNINKGIAFIELAGEMDIYTSQEFKNTLKDLLKSKKYKLIVNLEKVTYIDSAGVGTLLGALKKTKEKNGNLWLVYTQKSGVWKFFRITEIDNNFIVYKNKKQALRTLSLSYGQDRNI